MLVTIRRKESQETLDDRAFIRHQLHHGSESTIRRYSRLVLSKPGMFSLLKYELVNFIIPVPGAFGLALRRLFVKRLFAESGAGMIFGRSITLRHADNIRIGDSVVLDDYCLLDARGAGEKGIRLADRVMINRGASIQAKVGGITIGRETGIGAYSQIISQGPIDIAENVSIAGGTMISGGRYDVELSPDQPEKKGRFTGGPIVIEPNVRIGMRSIILDGVRIGRNAIVAAGSVVFDDVPADAVVIGCPARPLRQRRASSPNVSVPDQMPAQSQVDEHSFDAVPTDRKSKVTYVIRNYLMQTHNAEFGPGALSDDDSLFDNNVIDSIGLVSVITMIEDHFDIELDDNDLVPEKLSTVNGLVSIVTGKT